MGSRGSGEAYRLGVELDGDELMWSPGNDVPQCGWVTFEDWDVSTHKFTKGKQYEFRFTRGGSDSINYYYQTGNPYEHGKLLLGRYEQTDKDLCMRVYGAMDVIPNTKFGAYPYYPMPCYGEGWGCDPEDWEDRAVEAGLHQARLRVNWSWVENYGTHDAWPGLDEQYECLRGLPGGCEVYCNLFGCTDQTSTHWNADSRRFENAAPPSNLFLPVDSESNYFARHVKSLVRHFDRVSSRKGCVSVHVWEIWNESNLLEEYWKKPDARDYVGWNSPRQRCSIYVRLCQIADSVIKYRCGIEHRDDKILVGSLGDLEAETIDHGTTPWDTLKMKGKDWLRWMYEIACRPGGPGVFWDGVAYHHYEGGPYLPTFDACAEKLRAVMREHGDHGELWITETGWTSTAYGEDVQANALAEVFAMALASTTRPAGGYDRVDWFCFRNTGGNDPFQQGLTDTLTQDLKYSFHSFAHTASVMTGLRPNGRVLTGDPNVDAVTRIYEFEDPASGMRTWVGWRDGDLWGDVAAAVPVRTDRVELAPLDYGDAPAPSRPATGPGGWLSLALPARPVFISETGAADRPDMRVDSLRSLPTEPKVGKPCTLEAWVRNAGSGSASTLYGGLSFFRDGALLGEVTEPDTVLRRGGTTLLRVRLAFASVPGRLAGTGLFTATANPSEEYVELGTDNNSAFRVITVHPRSGR